MRLRKTILFILVLSLLHANVFGLIYCKIKGRVVDDETGAGIPDVNVQVHRFVHDSPQNAYVLTDKDGYFSFSNLKPGEYALNYIPLFPHVLDPQKRSDWTDHKRAFMVAEGEIKNIQHRLKKGGRLIVNYNSTFLDVNRCSFGHKSLDRIDGDDIIYDIETLYHEVINPKFVKIKGDKECSGLAEGQYIANFKMTPYGDYCDVVVYDIVGIPKIFDISKNKNTVLNIDFNSKSTLILDIVDVDGNKLNRGMFNIYKKEKIEGKYIFYNVFGRSFSPIGENRQLKSLIISPGEYLIEINAYPLVLDGQDRRSVELSEENYFEFIIKNQEIKNLKFAIKMVFDWDYTKYQLIH